MRVSIFDDRFLGMKPIRMTLELGDGLINIVVKISLMCIIIVFLGKLVIFYVPFALRVKIVCKIVYLPVLEG